MIGGISGYRRNAAVALGRDGGLLSVCEQGRVVRVRDLGVRAGGFPEAAFQMAARAAGVSVPDVRTRVVAEDGLAPYCPDALRLDHHLAHASTAFLTSPFDEAAVVVCDTEAAREVSVWRGRGRSLDPAPIEWRGPGFAGVYSRLTAALGLEPGQDEYRVEALARVASAATVPGAETLVTLGDSGLLVAAAFEERVADAVRQRGPSWVAGAMQRRIGELLVEFLGRVRRETGVPTLCLGGGLFFNTRLNTVVHQAGLFDRVFVPVNPGNAGVSAGCVLAASDGHRSRVSPEAASAFLGPSWSSEEVKSTLDNCKLSYDFVEDGQAVAQTVAALGRGELVAWLRGRLEWGARALGHRSIFANPLAPYVLENLNAFLKHREPHRAYGLLVRDEDVATHFDGPPRSPYMEFEYRPLDRDRFRHVCPKDVTALRVQTVGAEPALVRQLVGAFGQATGVPVLVNTSFNGFHEPIVCSPRDAVRVFYGSGLDMLVVGNFVLRK